MCLGPLLWQEYLWACTEACSHELYEQCIYVCAFQELRDLCMCDVVSCFLLWLCHELLFVSFVNWCLLVMCCVASSCANMDHHARSQFWHHVMLSFCVLYLKVESCECFLSVSLCAVSIKLKTLKTLKLIAIRS